MQAYKDKQGRTRLFRPELNMARVSHFPSLRAFRTLSAYFCRPGSINATLYGGEQMTRGARRMAFPTFEGDELIEMIKELLRVDDRWMPTEPGTSMYIRPTMIGTRASLGVGPSTEVLLFVM